MTSSKRLGVSVLTALAIAALVLLLPRESRADSLLFTGLKAIAPLPGTISYAGGANPLLGVGLGLQTVEDTTTLKTFNFINSTLTITTGKLTGSTADSWTFGPNSTPGAITLTGCVDVDGDGGACDASDVNGTSLNPILTGTLSSSIVTDPTLTGGNTDLVVSGVFDTKNPALLAAFGIAPPSGWNGSFDVRFLPGGAPGSGGNPFTSSTILHEYLTNVPTPEPATLSLLGLGLLGLGASTRKKLRKANV